MAIPTGEGMVCTISFSKTVSADVSTAESGIFPISAS